MYARVALIEADGAGLSRWEEHVHERIAPGATAVPGFVDGTWMRDDDTGTALAITVWTDQQAMIDADTNAAANRARLEEATRSSVRVLTGPVIERRHGDDMMN